MTKSRVAAALALLVVLLVAYGPALDGGFVWDDDAHPNHPDVRDPHGLLGLWFDADVLHRYGQYYPLTRSVFWLENQLWGGSTVGFHVFNVVLHWISALLVWSILLRLAVPGAGLAAAIFALHPVHVETVAWMTELKNTLSGVFYLAALRAYLEFAFPVGTEVRAKRGADPGEGRARGDAHARGREADDASSAAVEPSRRWIAYVGALVLFACALLSKTVTATLPAALLLIAFWKKGSLSWKRDVLPVLPFFAIGVGLACVTVWLERHVIGAKGADYVLSTPERFLIAGRAVWFYLAKLVWPADLVFVYPRWELDARSALQWLYPAAAVLVVVGLAIQARRTRSAAWRGALCVVLFFGGTLFPALGFVNVFPFLYSFVADHFQYLASLSMIALASAGIVVGARRLAPAGRGAETVIAAVLLAALAVRTWRQSHLYEDIETLWRTTIAANPSAWMAHNNLSLLLIDRGEYDRAREHLDVALRMKPDNAPSHNNLGLIYNSQGKPADAVRAFQRAIELKPDFTDAYVGLSYAQNNLGRPADAERSARAAIAYAPDNTSAHLNLGIALSRQNRDADALEELQRAIALDPTFASPYAAAGDVYAKQKNFDQALRSFEAAVARDPRLMAAHLRLAGLYAQKGDLDRAIASYRNALAIHPAHASAQLALGDLLLKKGDKTAAASAWREAARLDPRGEIGRRAQDALDKNR